MRTSGSDSSPEVRQRPFGAFCFPPPPWIGQCVPSIMPCGAHPGNRGSRTTGRVRRRGLVDARAHGFTAPPAIWMLPDPSDAQHRSQRAAPRRVGTRNPRHPSGVDNDPERAPLGLHPRGPPLRCATSKPAETPQARGWPVQTGDWVVCSHRAVLAPRSDNSAASTARPSRRRNRVVEVPP